ncbi:Endopeptidase La [Candidatus Bealeia paramacronuclearis]|uniref:Lon protease n=1 Tax=Candidatus Bealeia paramacronuclearis TaxID=1921001 RepID=A0ABZ2C3E7_9PROT|nr:Endopeptidase La [Candidatus Bealeia paramacronuclearis]
MAKKIKDVTDTSYPVLALRDVVVFPHMVVPLFVGREKSIKALDHASKNNKEVMLVTQKNSSLDDPRIKDLYTVGTTGRILQMLRLPDGTVKVLIEGTQRVKVESIQDNGTFFEGEALPLIDHFESAQELEALSRTIISQFDQYTKLNKKYPADLITTISQIDDAGKLSDIIAAHLGVKLDEKQKLLEMTDVAKRLDTLANFMEGEIGVMQAEKRIRSRVKRQMEKTQREYYLNEQLKAIQKELGENEEGRDEVGEIEHRIKTTKLSKQANERAESEVKKLRQMSPMSAEATVVRNYLDWLLDIPWEERSRIKKDLEEAEKILNEDHYGLQKVKERIIEYLAVQNRVGKIKGPIICLVGPPGVGKTSLGKSIARATGRQYVRMSLGGVRDEAEIRGHRRTYIGSMPGKIIQGMKKAKKSNPLFLLDEIDKMSSDWRGDPSSALLEVLDPEQNNTFNDHYLEIDYDLSDVLFITTANTLDMPQPLLDRMEIIRLSGYTEDEKLEISKSHLIPKQMIHHNLKSKEIVIEDSAIRDLIRLYTREAGVRSLEREINNICRKVVRKLASKKEKSLTITHENLKDYAGVPRFHYGEALEKDAVGVTTGLAWTEVGGELLSIEALMLPGKGKMQITGKLGEVMQESVQAAASFVKSRAALYGINPNTFEKHDIHVHVPEGATPKDGPSAGVAMCTSIVSVLTGIPVHREVAMTGEITLRGRVLAIGGLKEKLLAALRGGIKTVLIPRENEKDLSEIPDNVKTGMTVVPVDSVDEVLLHALTRPLNPISWEESLPINASKTAEMQEEIKAH